MVDNAKKEDEKARAKGNTVTPIPPEVAADLNQTMADNRAIGEMASTALKKLPQLAGRARVPGRDVLRRRGQRLAQGWRHEAMAAPGEHQQEWRSLQRVRQRRSGTQQEDAGCLYGDDIYRTARGGAV